MGVPQAQLRLNCIVINIVLDTLFLYENTVMLLCALPIQFKIHFFMTNTVSDIGFLWNSLKIYEKGAMAYFENSKYF